MKLKNVKLKFTGGVDGGRGWKGDVKNMRLDISKIKTLGWKPKHNTQQTIKKATQHIVTKLSIKFLFSAFLHTFDQTLMSKPAT